VTLTALAGYTAQILTQAKAILEAVAGVVNVTTGETHLYDWPSYDAVWRRPDGTLEGWVLIVPDVVEVPSATRESAVTVRVLIRGIRSAAFDPTTRLSTTRAAFQALVEAVLDAFRNSTLGGLLQFSDPVRSRLEDEALTEDRMIGDVLCHVAEIELVGHEWLVF
jgi:hypothetical protein